MDDSKIPDDFNSDSDSAKEVKKTGNDSNFNMPDSFFADSIEEAQKTGNILDPKMPDSFFADSIEEAQKMSNILDPKMPDSFFADSAEETQKTVQMEMAASKTSDSFFADSAEETQKTVKGHLVVEKRIPSEICSDDSPEFEAIAPGQQFANRYRIEGELGRGGMGIVYKAYDTRLKRVVALKLILRGEIRDFQRFIRESSAMAQLNHPNIIKLHDFGEKPQPFFTMEYIEGFTLADLIKEKKMKTNFLVDLMIKVCDALAHAHKNKILHRDIKPSNIMITNGGEPKIVDFGLAKVKDSEEKSLSKTGDVLGTIHYMSPEQIHGNPSEKSDIYSIGATIYEALTYCHVYQGDSYHNILFQILHRPPIPPRQLNPNISPYFEAVCLKCIAKKEQKRYESFRQLVRELKNLRDHKPIIAKRYTSWDVLKNFIADHKLVFGAMALIFFVLVVSLVFVTDAWRKAEKAKTAKEVALRKVEEANDDMRDFNKAIIEVVERIRLSDKYASFILDRDIIEPLESLFNKSVHLKNAEEYIFLRAIVLRNQDIGQGIKDYTTIIKKDPKHFRAYYNRGRLYCEQKEYKKALVDFNKCIELEPSYYDAYNCRGLIYRHFGLYERALADYNQSLKLNSKYSFVYRNRGVVYQNLNQHDKAIADFNKAVQINSESFQAYINRGVFYSSRRLYNKALDDYTRALLINPGAFEAYHNIGSIHAIHKKYKEALAFYNKSILVDPSQFLAYQSRGNVYKKLEKYKLAIENYEKVISLTPNYWKPYDGLYQCYKALGNDKRAHYYKKKAEQFKKKN
ncbi:protein kinase domain-containing protein [Candidatus Uabimicrobium amorphum]|uniref:non-specific serine/threonine protein kinase n=1 Tax=Uabimicrobium amorphum TaxID=2596890 RepID=A0A5S9IU57_UABAM|nr:serine/threonine-protein kinase [Candidatus Uabimicrobium amorphum]BBM88198.1 serine/threonine protein kinase [Candidatus Uabimicrobium amorphum]